MIKTSHFIILYILILISCSFSLAQEIMTADGHSMGAKSVFMGVCTENMGANIPEIGAPYSVEDFCNCMADELLPTYTKSQINYYFTQGHMDEMLADSTSSQIIIGCVLKNINTSTSPLSQSQAPSEILIHEAPIIRSDARDSLVSELRIISNYEAYFDSIRELRLTIIADEYDWNSQRMSEIRSKVKFSDFDMNFFYSAYSRYSTEELKEILEYLKEMSEDELARSNVKHERIILMNIDGSNGGNMDSRIKRAAKE